MTAIGIFGARGRMGQAIAGVAADRAITVAGGTDGEAGGVIGAQGAAITADPAALALGADVLIDFSVPRALDAHLAACITAG